jgi:hypothetical protein
MPWKFFLDFKPWTGDSNLYVQHTTWDRKRRLLLPASFVDAPDYLTKGDDKPFLGQTPEQRDDGLGDVDQFLQAALDCAWERGMRPTGFKDFTNEIAAVRYHLEDMRKLAFQPHVTVEAAR